MNRDEFKEAVKAILLSEFIEVAEGNISPEDLMENAAEGIANLMNMMLNEYLPQVADAAMIAVLEVEKLEEQLKLEGPEDV